MKTSSKVMITIGSLLGVIVIVTMINFHRTDEYCGVIEHKIEHEYVRKHRAYRDPIFIMKFGELKYAVNVELVTYMDHNEGDNLCFTLSDCAVGKTPFEEKWLLIPSLIGVVLILIGLINNVTSETPWY